MSNLPPKYDPTGAGTPQSDEETDAPLLADHRNFYKVEKWSKDGAKVERMLYAGNSLDRARAIFQAEFRRRSRGRYTIRPALAGARSVAARLMLLRS